MSKKPLVSVVTITYNHSRYIRQALDSILVQEGVEFELIVADDASTDDTADIIRAYAKKHKNIVPILHKNNVGITQNLIGAMNKAKGTYIALCEGDDFWIDNKKLLKQTHYMAQHANVAVLFHPVSITSDNGKDQLGTFPNSDDIYTIDKLVAHNFIQTNSVLYKNIGPYIGVFHDNALPLDWLLHVFHALHGQIGFQKDTMAVYRRHSDSVWWRSPDTYVSFWQKNGPRHLAMYKNMMEIVNNLAPDLVDKVRKSSSEQVEVMMRELASVNRLDITEKMAIDWRRAFIDFIEKVLEDEKVYKTALDVREVEIQNMQEKLKDTTCVNEDLRLGIENERAVVRAIYDSTSWRITYPLRWMADVARKLVKSA